MLNKKISIAALTLFIASCNCSVKSHEHKISKADNKVEKQEIKAQEEPKAQEISEKQTIYFDLNSSELTNEAINALNQDILPEAKDPKVTKIVIEGYCDQRGSVDYNKALGKKRAEAVKNYLVKQGIKSSNIKTISYGKSQLVDNENNEQAWAKNRRVITIFVK